MTSTIVSLGSALQDIYLIDRDDFIPHADGDRAIFGEIAIGTKVDIDRISYEVGGGGTNAAVTFARHNHRSVFIGNIGKDMAGEAIIDCLTKEGVDSSFVTRLPRKNTGNSVIMLDIKSGERTILTYRGASAKFDNLDESALTEIKPDWIYATTMRGDLDTMKRFFKKAKSLGARIMLNPGKLEIKKREGLLKLLPYVDVLLVNRVEAVELLGSQDAEDPLVALLDKLAKLVQIVIITDGCNGAVATDGEKSYQFGIYEDIPVKDTTGAGDAFGSGFLAHFAAGSSFRSSLIFGSANSTFVVARLGAKQGIISGDTEIHNMPIRIIKKG